MGFIFFYSDSGEKNFHIFYYFYAGLYHQDKLKNYRLPDKTPPRYAMYAPPPLSFWPSLCHRSHVWKPSPRPALVDVDVVVVVVVVVVVFCRYIDSQDCKVMQDIVSSKQYKEQFDEIQDCFRIIGFTEEVTGIFSYWIIIIIIIYFFISCCFWKYISSKMKNMTK